MATELTPSTAQSFPSPAHYQMIRKLLRDSGYSVFTKDQLWYYHAYDYGWRRVFLLRRETVSPIDAEGRWYNGLMADRAERMFQDRRKAADRERKEIAARDPAVRERDERFRQAEEWRRYSPEAQQDPAVALATHSRAKHVPIDAGDERAFDGHRKLTETEKYRALQTALGVTAREWTSEEMAAGRKQIGISDGE